MFMLLEVRFWVFLDLLSYKFERNLFFRILQVENEENVLVCLRIIIELHKQYRPAYNIEVSFLS